jgi:hypothetical protein
MRGTREMAMRKDDEPWLVGNPGLRPAELGWHPQTDLEAGNRAEGAFLADSCWQQGDRTQ